MRRALSCWAGVLAVLAAPPASAVDDGAPLVALVLDSSGSVGAADLAQARDLAAGIMDGLPPGSQTAVFTFDDQSRLLLPATANADELKSALDAVRVSGRFTALYDALYDASRYLRASPSRRRAIVLVTDGRDENSALTLDDGLRVAEESSIPVYAVGIGRAEERVLRRIARLTGGEYFASAEASAATIAERILQTTQANEATPPPAPSPVPSSLEAPAPEPEPREHPGRLVMLSALLLAGLLVAGGLALLMLKRGRGLPRCPGCGRELASAGSECVWCLTREPAATDTVTGWKDDTLATGRDELERTVLLGQRSVLVVTKGAGNGQSHSLSAATVTSVGRARANDIVVDDVAVSSQHCRIRPEQGRLVLYDLDSTNGTYVNERRVNRHALSAGDVIRLGETCLELRLEPRGG